MIKNTKPLHPGQVLDEVYMKEMGLNQSQLAKIETKRLILRPLVITDAESIYEYAKNPNVSQYTLWEPHKSINDSATFITDYAFKMYGEQTPEPLGIALKDNPEKIVGTVGCFWVF